MPSFSVGAARRMCASAAITGSPSGARSGRRRRTRPSPSGAPRDLRAADRLLLVAEGRRSQTSMSMRMRRATRYEPPRIQAGPSSSPTQTCSRSAA